MVKFAKEMFPFITAVMLLVLGVAKVSMAGSSVVPEIDATTGMSAVALIAGAVLIIRGRRKK